MKRLLSLLLLSCLPLFAQTGPQINLSGSIGVPGSAPTLAAASVVIPTDANYTLTAPQYASNSLNVTSSVALTATRNVVAPLNYGQQFTVTNATTGGQSIQIVGTSGAGAVVPNGQTVIVNSPDGTKYQLASSASTGGGVTSVGVSVPAYETVSGSPVTGAGTIAITANTQTAHTALMGPTTGTSVPTYRAIDSTDLPVATTGALGAVKPDGTTITISAGVISSIGGGTGGLPYVACGGTDDYAAMQASLTTGGNVTWTGNCNLVAHGYLVAKSKTSIYAYGATITGAPTGIAGLLTNTQQVNQTIARTCTDITMTVGSNVITSPTCNFTQADVEQDSISCIGGYAGGLDWKAQAFGNDLHTTMISAAIAGTSAVLADVPTAVSNPMTCNFLTRDEDVRVYGGTWIQTGPSVGMPIKLMTVNKPVVQDVIVANTSFTDGGFSSGGGSQDILIQDASFVRVINVNVNGWAINQDGVHMDGPIHDALISGVTGHSGDNYAMAATTDGCPATGQLQLDCRTYGAVSNVTFENIDGNSANNFIGVSLWTNYSGAIMPFRATTVRNVHGADTACIRCSGASNTNTYAGFGQAVKMTPGVFEDVTIDGISGQFNGAVQVSGTVGHLTIANVNVAASAYVKPLYLIQLDATSSVARLDVHGLYDNGHMLSLSPGAFVSMLYGANVGTFNIDGLEESNWSNGNSLLWLSGTIGTLSVDGHVVNNQTANFGNGIVWLNGATIGHYTSKIKLDHTGTFSTVLNNISTLSASTHGCGSGASCPVSVGDVVIDSSIDSPASSVTDTVINGPVNTSILYNNNRFNNISSCGTSLGIVPGFGTNYIGTIVTPASCSNATETIVAAAGTAALSGTTATSMVDVRASITSWTIGNGQYNGQSKTIVWRENVTGGWTVGGKPSNVLGSTNPFPATTNNTCSVFTYEWQSSAVATVAWLQTGSGLLNVPCN